MVRLVNLLIGLVGEWLFGIYCGYSRVSGLVVVGIVLCMWNMWCVMLVVFMWIFSVFGV